MRRGNGVSRSDATRVEHKTHGAITLYVDGDTEGLADVMTKLNGNTLRLKFDRSNNMKTASAFVRIVDVLRVDRNDVEGWWDRQIYSLGVKGSRRAFLVMSDDRQEVASDETLKQAVGRLIF